MINEDFKLIFQKIDSYDFFKVTTKYQSAHKASSEQVSQVLCELKKWLALCAANPGKKYHIGSHVDDMWHVFILFTKDYSDFCDKCIGFFLHHEPNISEETTPINENNDELFSDYEKHFLKKPPTTIWPRYHAMPGEGGNPRPCHCIYMPR
ncbi:hypothetical protein [Pseudomonas sp. PDM30]|uniref:glycine-rich domain-containing protein n=1 Tax=Pseudomonas sp. PDM30 TaxID=2854773 RepID=UPI001C43C5F2|nr:hypothetical protein [Pseudomonas sp. PDM30]MBV7491156.1 hypothetical protein [Pseudomonas sp. PDM30]